MRRRDVAGRGKTNSAVMESTHESSYGDAHGGGIEERSVKRIAGASGCGTGRRTGWVILLPFSHGHKQKKRVKGAWHPEMPVESAIDPAPRDSASQRRLPL